MDYTTIGDHSTAEQLVKKSRFIVNCYHVESEEEVQKHLKSVNKTHYKATHNTYAYVLGAKKEVQKYSDDGEPSGTAGKPILESIMSKDLTDILVVVTRYFGGIKLGSGGLIRAYHSTGLLGISKSSMVKMQYSYLVQLTFDYSHLNRIQSFILSNNIRQGESEYQDKVSIVVYIPYKSIDRIRDELVELTNDQVEINTQKEEYLRVEIS